MTLRLTKTSKVVFAISIFLLSGVLGYLVWRVNQPETVAPTESEAGGEILIPPQPPGGGTRGDDEWYCVCCDYGATGNITVIQTPASSGWIEDCRAACTEYDGWRGDSTNNCGLGVTDCFCEAYAPAGSDLCAYNCQFPEGTQEEVDTQAESSCSPKIAMCYGDLILIEDNKYLIETRVEIEDYIPSHPCYGLTDQCNNPFADDPCKEVEVEAVCGDGNIDEGEECDPDAVPNGCESSQECSNSCICLDKGWSVEKSVTESCLGDGTDSPISELTYTITVFNSGSTNSNILKIEDVLDSKVELTSIGENITPPGEYVDGEIVWDFSESPLEVTAKSSVIFSYKVNVSKEGFGLYENTVTVTPQSDLPVTDTANIQTTCESSTPTETVPETGIFDSTLGRIFVGLVLVIFGAFVYTLPSNLFLGRVKEEKYTYRSKFERKIERK